MPKDKNLDLWQNLVSEIREWDRQEHNWAVSTKQMPHKNIRTKNNFVRGLMKKYKIKKHGKK